IAARAGNRRRYRAFASLRAVQALAAMGQFELALHHVPEINQLPLVWQELAVQLRDDLVANAVLSPAVHRQSGDAVIQYEAWAHFVDLHPDRAHFLRHLSTAFLDLGLYSTAVTPLRDQLRLFPDANEEARLALQLAR